MVQVLFGGKAKHKNQGERGQAQLCLFPLCKPSQVSVVSPSPSPGLKMAELSEEDSKLWKKINKTSKALLRGRAQKDQVVAFLSCLDSASPSLANCKPYKILLKKP